MHPRILALLLPLARGSPIAESSGELKSNETIISEWLQDLATLPFDHTGFFTELNLPPAIMDSATSLIEGSIFEPVDSNRDVLDFASGLHDGQDYLKTWPNMPRPQPSDQMQVLNFPAYANWTQDDTWNIRIRAFVHEVPEFSKAALDVAMWEWEYGLGEAILEAKDQDEFTPEELDHYANMTKSLLLFGDAWKDHPITLKLTSEMNLESAASNTSSDFEPAEQQCPDALKANRAGDIESPIVLDDLGMRSINVSGGAGAGRIQTLRMNVPDLLNGHSTAYLVPREGITVLSDIDDTLRLAQVWNPELMLNNTFTRPFQALDGMPQIFANWSANIPDVHFHYLSAMPEQLGRQYLSWMQDTYPHGSFDMRPNEEGESFRGGSVRKYFMNQIKEYFPERRFILKDPGHVLCIFIRNVTASDPSDWMGYDTSGFAGIPKNRYMFFNHPEDLMGLDVMNGECLNRTLVQSVEFKEQDGKVDEDRDEGVGHCNSPAMPFLTSMTVLVAAFAMMW